MTAVLPIPSTVKEAPSYLAIEALQALIKKGVYEFCLCPSKHNAPLVYPLAKALQQQIYYWPEERSAAYFALGRIKASGRPVAVVTTSGTAVGELLPAAMEAFYTGLPLVLLTADRPRRFRGTGAPQSAEQVGLFSHYVEMMLDLAEGEACCLDQWKCQGPLHLNVCFEEPQDSICQKIQLEDCQVPISFTPPVIPFYPDESYREFLHTVRFPLVVVSALPADQREAAIRYLLHLQAPVYAEGISGIREDPRLKPLVITRSEQILNMAARYQYPIDGILRLGGVPTVRLWRDLEDREGQLQVYSVNEQPFSGLSWGGIQHTSFSSFFAWAQTLPAAHHYPFTNWQEADQKAQQALLALFHEEPLAESSLIHALSRKIPKGSKIYLGNSLPIREWDLAAAREPHGFQLSASRGLNGIDGQIATFLGYVSKEQDNWAILGDLTVLYDLAGFWIMPQLSALSANIVVVNNGGAGIFTRMFSHPAFYNVHELSFEPLARFWGWRYERWNSIPDSLLSSGGGLFNRTHSPSTSDRTFLASSEGNLSYAIHLCHSRLFRTAN